MIHCYNTVNGGEPCYAQAMHGTDPPVCAARANLSVTSKGNRNTVTHGYYPKGISEQEVSELFAGAAAVSLA